MALQLKHTHLICTVHVYESVLYVIVDVGWQCVFVCVYLNKWVCVTLIQLCVCMFVCRCVCAFETEMSPITTMTLFQSVSAADKWLAGLAYTQSSDSLIGVSTF